LPFSNGINDIKRKVSVEGYEVGAPDEVLNPKKKIWEKLQVV
jgi:hypothetical protein